MVKSLIKFTEHTVFDILLDDYGTLRAKFYRKCANSGLSCENFSTGLLFTQTQCIKIRHPGQCNHSTATVRVHQVDMTNAEWC